MGEGAGVGDCLAGEWGPYHPYARQHRDLEITMGQQWSGYALGGALGFGIALPVRWALGVHSLPH